MQYFFLLDFFAAVSDGVAIARMAKMTSKEMARFDIVLVIDANLDAV